MKSVSKILSFLISIVVFLIFVQKVVAQTGYGFPAADNKFLGVTGNIGQGIDVDKYSGKLVLNIPLTQISGKSQVIPVQLSYSSGGGIRHQEYSGAVGLGWQLVAGGSITRVVRALPDEHTTGYLGPGEHGKIIRDAAVNNTALHEKYFNRITISDGLRYYDQVYDSEPDLFFVNTPAFSFQFSFDENGNPVTSNNSAFKIVAVNFNNSSNYTNSSFVVKDDQGNTYYFGTSSGFRNTTTEKLCGVQRTYTSTWHLEKIVNADNTDTISFYYNKPGSSGGKEKYYQYSWDYTRLMSTTSENLQFNENVQEMDNYYLSSILTKYGRIVFYYESGRKDVEGGAPRLSTISSFVYTVAGERLNQKIVLGTSYFGSVASPPAGARLSDRCRLRLDSIRIYSGEKDLVGQRYKKFEYQNSGSAFDRKDNNTDYFGFRTTFPSGDPMKNPELRKPHSLAATGTYMLFKITERTNAYTQISYGFNTVYQNDSQPADILGGLRVQEIQTFESSTSSLKRRFQYEFEGRSTGSVYGANYSTLSLIANNGNYFIEKIFSGSLANYSDLNGYFVGYGRVREINANNSYSDYNYQDFRSYPDKLTTYQSGSSVFFGGVLTGSSISYAHKRGLLSRVSNYNNANKLLSQTDYQYVALNANEIRSSYGVVSRVTGASISGQSGFIGHSSLYFTPIENYRLANVINRAYDESVSDTSKNITQTTTYAYHPNKNYIRSIETKDSKAVVKKKTLYYPEDGNSIPMVNTTEVSTLNTLKGQNILGIIVHESQQLAQNELLHTHNIFQAPFKLMSTSNYRKITAGSINHKVAQQLNFYESGSNRLAMTQTNNGTYSSIGYDKYDRVVIEISNAMALPLTGTAQGKYYEFYYEGFEDQASVASYAGLGSGQTNFTVPFVATASRKYLIDYWYLNTNGTWTYVKKPYSNNIILTEGTRIDEVRVYPEDAQIKTFGYNELGLKTSESNTFGQTVFYKYDIYNRLQLVMDQDNNILKSYCYNISGDRVDCFANLVEETNRDCNVQAVPGWDLISRYIYKSNTEFKINYIALGLQGSVYYSSSDWYYNGIVVANILGDCRPISTLTQRTSLDGREYEFTVHSNGDIKIRLTNSTSSIPQPGYLGTFNNIVFQ